jgi:hypothetical protein
MVKNAKNLIMALIYYELPHLTLKTWKKNKKIKKIAFGKKTMF